ncbi:hypothetical protein Avbf_09376 [Armadillidium vulgare]|nr:hypothetical protein Avbf_09376 [Armadillidium vulgare]
MNVVSVWTRIVFLVMIPLWNPKWDPLYSNCNKRIFLGDKKRKYLELKSFSIFALTHNTTICIGRDRLFIVIEFVGIFE